ncbi:MAG: hypothetical protein JRD89_05475 [Deltaproteobacteria bacterium]|nr:hypothetical protein [Deltaproteobacteria bacterium]
MEEQKPGTATNNRYWRILVRAMWIALGVHVMFIALFYSIGATFLVMVMFSSMSSVSGFCAGSATDWSSFLPG